MDRLPVYPSSKGFSLLEILMVMGIIAALFSAILPNLTLTPSSQISAALRDLTGTIRASYDGAVLSGRMHRLVLSFNTQEYWTEMAPEGYEGRPPAMGSGDTTNSLDERQRFLDELEAMNKDPRKIQGNEDQFYSIRSVIYQQKRHLIPILWTEVNDALLFRRKLPGEIGFWSAATESQPEKVEYGKTTDKESISLFFMPQGTALQASIQLGLIRDKNLVESGPKYTIVVDPLMARSELLEGFQDVEFVKSKK